MNDHPAQQDIDHLMANCKIRFQRRSGPGGQHRNKVETAVVLQHIPTGIRAEASEKRSQGENRLRAVFRLRILLAIRYRSHPLPTLPVTPSEVWCAHCHHRRLAVNANHENFPTILAEALDAVAANAFHLPHTAEQLATSSSQLLRLFRVEPEALTYLNDQRRKGGQRPLK